MHGKRRHSTPLGVGLKIIALKCDREIILLTNVKADGDKQCKSNRFSLSLRIFAVRDILSRLHASLPFFKIVLQFICTSLGIHICVALVIYSVDPHIRSLC